MGKCKYCGKPAGLFKSRHVDCEAAEMRRLSHVGQALSRIHKGTIDSIKSSAGRPVLAVAIHESLSTKLLTEEAVRNALIVGWSRCVDVCLEDGVIDVDEERRLVQFQNEHGLTQLELDTGGAHSKVVKSAVLRDLLSGILPQRMKMDEPLPINLQKGEKIVWAYNKCSYLEDKVNRQYVGGSRGASIKIMKGVYYRVGAFKGSTISTVERVLVDRGLVILTDKNIYFAGPTKSLRIPYSKVVTFLPFEDGVGLIRDTQTAKPQIFTTGDGWFSYNLLVNLAQFNNK